MESVLAKVICAVLDVWFNALTLSSKLKKFFYIKICCFITNFCIFLNFYIYVFTSVMLLVAAMTPLDRKSTFTSSELMKTQLLRLLWNIITNINDNSTFEFSKYRVEKYASEYAGLIVKKMYMSVAKYRNENRL